MPGLSHFWQRLLLGAALLFGLLVGVAATVFGYSNTGTVNVGFSLWRLDGVPLWTVALVPVGLVLVVGTLYHWYNSFHHFTEHMRHRRRVHELEDEVARLRSHLDHVLEMPGAAGALPAKHEPEVEPAELEPSPFAETTTEASAAAAPPDDPGVADGAEKPARKASSSRRRAVLAASAGEPAVEAPASDSNGNGSGSSEAPEA